MFVVNKFVSVLFRHINLYLNGDCVKSFEFFQHVFFASDDKRLHTYGADNTVASAQTIYRRDNLQLCLPQRTFEKSSLEVNQNSAASFSFEVNHQSISIYIFLHRIRCPELQPKSLSSTNSVAKRRTNTAE